MDANLGSVWGSDVIPVKYVVGEWFGLLDLQWVLVVRSSEGSIIMKYGLVHPCVYDYEHRTLRAQQFQFSPLTTDVRLGAPASLQCGCTCVNTPVTHCRFSVGVNSFVWTYRLALLRVSPAPSGFSQILASFSDDSVENLSGRGERNSDCRERPVTGDPFGGTHDRRDANRDSVQEESTD